MREEGSRAKREGGARAERAPAERARGGGGGTELRSGPSLHPSPS